MESVQPLALEQPTSEQHEYFLVTLLDLADRVLDNGVTAGKAFLLQTFPDQLGGVILLAPILLEHLADAL